LDPHVAQEHIDVSKHGINLDFDVTVRERERERDIIKILII
jgi:hypothetical protein